jgi:hypothetical protein
MKEKQSKKKRPYQAPKVDSREIYEVNAAACSKCPSASNISLQPLCASNKRFS